MNITRIGQIFGAIATLGFACHAGAAQSTFLNDGQLLFAPQVDATNFVNYGYINIFTGLPFQTRSTRSFINLGEMNGVPGFDFQLVTSSGSRQLASSFANGPSGIIRASNSFPLGTAVNAMLSIRATNIVNQGELSADITGVVRLEAKTINLTRSAVGIRPISGGIGTNGPTSFSPDVGVNDSWWSFGSSATATPLNTLVTQGTGGHSRALSPFHSLTNQNNQALTTQLNLNDALPFVYAAQNGSNFVIQGVFVQRLDPRLNVNVRFAPSTTPSNLYQTAVVQFSRNETNALSGLVQANNIYLIDELASGTNTGLSTNVSSLITFKPVNYNVTRENTPPDWLRGLPPTETDSRFLAFPSASALGANSIPGLFYNASYTNNMADLGSAAYQFYFTNVIAPLPNLPGVSLTNQAGRVEITTDSIDLTRARIRTDGSLILSAKNVITSKETVIDAPNFALNLNPPNGNLVISNLVRSTVDRTTGPLMAWSGVWSNNAIVVTTSFGPDTNNPGMFTEIQTTNNATIQFHILMVDSRQVATTLLVYVPSLVTSSPNLTIYDTLRLNERVDVRSKGLTVAPGASLLMSGQITHWNSKILTNLDSLTNRGKISFGGSIAIGVSPARRLNRIVNSGQLGGIDFAIRAGYFENSGSITRTNITFPSVAVPPALLGAIRIDASETLLVGGQIGDTVSAGAISINANNLTLSNQSITTPSSITLTVTNRLTDSGGNLITARGFHMPSTPRSGDLLGTTINSTISTRFGINLHTWAGRDRGPQIEGFTNNAALGRLILRGNTLSLHEFKGASEGNALYVKVLELQNMLFSQIQDLIQLDGDFKLYFQEATPFSAAQIDQIGSNYFGGRLKWVPADIGPVAQANARANNSFSSGGSTSETVAIGSANLPNPAGSAATPNLAVPGIRFSSVSLGGATPEIHFSWTAAPMTSYILESTTDLQSTEWQALEQFSNASTEAQLATLKDSTAAGAQRFYRLRVK